MSTTPQIWKSTHNCGTNKVLISRAHLIVAENKLSFENMECHLVTKFKESL